MSVIIVVAHYCLDMTFRRWPRCCSVQSCRRGAKDVITRCRISLGVPWIRSRIGCFMSPNCEDVFRMPCFWPSAWRVSQVLQYYANGRHEKWLYWETLTENLNGYLFCVSSCSERHFTAHGDGQYESVPLAVKLVCKFQKPWDISGSHIPPAPLILQYQTTVELNSSGLNGTESHPDVQKIRIIGFFFENRLHWQFDVRLLLFTICSRV